MYLNKLNNSDSKLELSHKSTDLHVKKNSVSRLTTKISVFFFFYIFTFSMQDESMLSNLRVFTDKVYKNMKRLIKETDDHDLRDLK